MFNVKTPPWLWPKNLPRVKNLSCALALLLVGCATTDNTRAVKIDSDPPGARVFFGIGPNEDQADAAKNYIGTTPLEWRTKARGDGSFEFEGIFVYSMAVRPAAVFTCEPTAAQTNLFKKRQVFHGGAMFQPPDKIPEGIFFDLRKP
jgi:hypothetical protein